MLPEQYLGNILVILLLDIYPMDSACTQGEGYEAIHCLLSAIAKIRKNLSVHQQRPDE